MDMKTVTFADLLTRSKQAAEMKTERSVTEDRSQRSAVSFRTKEERRSCQLSTVSGKKRWRGRSARALPWLNTDDRARRSRSTL